MQFFFVNHSQTHKDELGDGYLWSPKTKSDGKPSWSYNNMKKVKPGDIVFSFAETEVKAIGCATSEAYTAPKPIGFSETWNQSGWKIDVDFERINHPFRLKENLDEFRHMLPDIYSPISLNNGNGNQGCYLAHISSDFADYLIKQSNIIFEIESIDDNSSPTEIRATEKLGTVRQRIGQSEFKRRLINIHDGRCQLTGTRIPELLRASHIKPWSNSESTERLDPHNGLLLASHIDALFDRGLITFTSEGIILFFRSDIEEFFDSNQIPKKLSNLSIQSQKYMEYHTEHVFQKFVVNKKLLVSK